MRDVFGFFLVAGVAAAGIGVSIALGKRTARRHKPLGADPYADTGEPEIDPAEYEIAPGSYSNEDNPSRPHRDEPGYEGGCLLLGRKHHNFGDPYRVCLTQNQEQKLFKGKRTKLRKLGCGTFACAYESPLKSRVIKFTRDSEDVAGLLKAQKTGVVPKVHAVFKLKQGGRTTPQRNPFTMRVDEPRHVDVYAMVVDRLETPPADERYALEEDMQRLRHAIDTVDKERKPLTIDNVCRLVNNDGDWGDDTEGSCTSTQMLVLDAVGKLRKIGIDWGDIHAGNFGYDKRGKLKVLDLGVTKTQLEREPEVLEGRQRAASMLLRGLPAA